MTVTKFVPQLQDAELVETKAFPAAGANHNTGTFDLTAVQPNKSTPLMMKVVVPACPNHTNTGAYNLITLQHSTDDITYTDVNPLHQIKMVGVGTTGYAGDTYHFYLPPNVNRYVQLNILVPSNGGTNTAVTVTAGLVFGK